MFMPARFSFAPLSPNKQAESPAFRDGRGLNHLPRFERVPGAHALGRVMPPGGRGIPHVKQTHRAH